MVNDFGNNYSQLNSPGLPNSGLPDLSNLTGKQFRALKKAYITERLQNHFPSTPTILYAILYILIGLATISLQIILIINQAFNYQVANGIWGGLICIIVAIINLNLSKIIKLI